MANIALRHAMRLTGYTDLSLRTLIFLGIFRERLVQRAEIAEAFDVSLNHLAKVVNHLARLGYIHAKRGRHGGLELAIEPEDIGIGEIVREFEPDYHIVECFDPETNTCPIAPVCELGSILEEALFEFQAVLEKYTLADMIARQKRKRYVELLGPLDSKNKQD